MEDNSKDRVGYFYHAIDRCDLQPGDHIYVYNSWLSSYSHHGIYTGDDRVIHFTGGGQGGWSSFSNSSTAKSTARIQACTLDEFLNGNQLRLVAYGVKTITTFFKRPGSSYVQKCHSAQEVIETAEYYLQNPQKWGEYHLLKNNCEHFAHCCKTGIKRSAQIDFFVSSS